MRIRRFLTILFCLTLSFGATACGGGATGETPGTNPPDNDPPAADTAAPVVTLGDMATTLVLGDTLTVSFTVSDNVSAADDIYTEVKIFNSENVNVTSQVYTAATKVFNPKSAGEYRIVIEAYDEASNPATATHRVVVSEPSTEEPGDGENPITAVSFGNTTQAGYAGVRTKFYTAAAVTGGGKATFTARLLRGNSYKYAVEVAGGIDGDVFIPKTSGTHWLEITAKVGEFTLTDSKKIEIGAVGATNTLYSFTWEHVDTLDYTGFEVGDKYVKFLKSDDVPRLMYAFDGTVTGSYTMGLSLSGLEPDTGKDTAAYTPFFSVTAITGNSREDVFSVQVNGNNTNGKYIATDFKENGGSFPFSHYDTYQITEDLTGDTAMTIARYGKSYTVKMGDEIKAERISDTTEAVVTGVAFSTTGAIGEVRDITLVKETDPPVEIPEYVMPTQPTYRDVSVHDPSVFLDPVSEEYYIFGSHFAVAKSSDLKIWNNVGTGASSLYGTADWTSVLSKAHAYVSAGVSNWQQNTWAPDVEYYNNKYYMYFSLTSEFGSSKSFIGRVESDNVEGPYKGEVEIVKSDGTGGCPNAIDPELYYDKDGGLWMVYGSFFGGIYVKKLYNQGANWGLPMPADEYPANAGYGKKVWAGGSGGPEGPFVFYNAELDYYYMIASYGDLNTVYNMRVARSKNPDGPYTDITGADVAVSGGGNKLAGNYQFADETVGYAAAGHNSVIKVGGKYLNIFHTRFREGTGNGVSSVHRARVHQLFFNEAGWPVMSPARYADEEVGKVTLGTGYGTYDVIVHTKGTNQTFIESERYTFDLDGTIRVGSTARGSWEIKENYFVNITLDGTVYRGVIAPSWCDYRNKAVLTMTATSAEGVPLWANRV